MGCCHQKKLASAVRDFVKEVRLVRKLMFPPNPPVRSSLGTTRAISEETELDMIYETYEQENLGDLPPAVGRDADIAKGVLIVQVDGAETDRHDVQYDLTTRVASGSVPWKARKGGDVVLQLGYVDDDGNTSELFTLPFGIAADTIPPNVPVVPAIGTTRNTGEVDV